MVAWSKAWQLPLSPHKTSFMRLTAGSSVSPTHVYKIEGAEISAVTSVKDLGFVYTNKLDFSEHIKIRCKLVMLRTFQIFKALSVKSKHILLKAYKTYVRPIVESSATVFNPTKMKDIYSIERVQNNFTRKLLARVGGFLYSRIPRASIRNKYLGLSSLEPRRRVFDVCLVHKILHSSVSEGPKNFFRMGRSRTRAVFTISLLCVLFFFAGLHCTFITFAFCKRNKLILILILILWVIQLNFPLLKVTLTQIS
ncbi:hypothetical protein Y032_0041g488 [Ancylostoma ceylanicum]|nr:hypothetical protein Y032_0041g488 [Ancylostoma ceylanicum]